VAAGLQLEIGELVPPPVELGHQAGELVPKHGDLTFELARVFP
jgi:hypothetical protein